MSSNRIIAPALAVALALAAGACASTPSDSAKVALTPNEQYKVKVEQTPEQLALGPHADGLSAAQSTALGQFAGLWRDAGEGEIVIKAPTTGDQAAVSRSTAATQAELTVLGVPRTVVRVESYEAAGGDTRPPVLVSFQRYTAKGPDCSQGWDNLTSTGENRASTHYGCAIIANFAAQLANPRDALQPTPTDAPDAGRRSTVLELYRKGQLTSTVKDEQASGAVSKVVQ
jgi:pilus assembly protein CpaD